MRTPLILAIVCSNILSSAAETIPNFSFESPGFSGSGDFVIVNGNDITGWTIGGAGMDYFSNQNNSLFASDGTYSINYIRGPGDSSFISTTISGLTSGLTYDLSFDLIQRDPGAGNALTASVDLTSLTFINSLSDVWQTRDLNFVASGASATLTFAGPSQGAVDSAYAHIDNVHIAAVPEPSTCVLFAVGALLALSRRKRA